MGQSIINRDIAFYDGEIERAMSDIRRATPDEERFIRSRLRSARAVVCALKEYRIELLNEGAARVVTKIEAD